MNSTLIVDWSMFGVAAIWGLQGLMIAIDEFYFHHRRVIPQWERIGHPVDTLLFLVCFLFCVFVQPKRENAQAIFIALAGLSCVIISKDEWIHKKYSDGAENWLHSLLFIIHPLSLFVLYQLWMIGNIGPIILQSIVIFLFMSYQIVYWNFYQKRTLGIAK